jgi:hypothetical protein
LNQKHKNWIIAGVILIGFLSACDQFGAWRAERRAIAAEKQQQLAFEQRVMSAPRTSLEISEGRGTDDLLDRAHWDQSEWSPEQWQTVQRIVCKINHKDPDNPNWWEGKRADVPLSWK